MWFVSWDCNELAGLRKGGPRREDVVQASQWNVCPAKHTVHIMCCFSSCHIHMSLFWRKQEWQSSLWLSIHLLPVTTPPLEGHGGLDPSHTGLEAGNTPDMSPVNSPDTYRRRTIYSHIHLVTNYPFLYVVGMWTQTKTRLRIMQTINHPSSSGRHHHGGVITNRCGVPTAKG